MASDLEAVQLLDGSSGSESESSDGEESLCEEEIEDEGCKEVILVPKRTVSIIAS